MLSFRQKILLAYLGVFLLFLVLLFPFATRSATQITVRAMENRANELIQKITLAPDEATMVRRLKDQKPLLFFRITLFSDALINLYDTHSIRVERIQEIKRPVSYPGVLDALRKGRGVYSDYSNTLGQRFLYLSQTYDFQGRKYVMRMAVPYSYIAELTRDFELGFLSLGSISLLLFSLLSWFVIARLSDPINQIIDAVRPYQKGLQTEIPQIELSGLSVNDDFSRLANTLNRLTERSRQQILALESERNEKTAILDALVEAVFAVDDKLIVQDCNSVALDIFGKSREEVIGRPFEELDCPDALALLQSSVNTGEICNDTVEIPAEHKMNYYDSVAAPLQSKRGGVLVMADTSVLHRVLEMRKDFIANASHELKTPITVINGFAETLRDNPGVDTELRTSILDKIVRHCARMNDLVKDLLALADIENLPESALKDIDLRLLYDGCERHVLSAYPEAQIHLDIQPEDAPLKMLGDPSLIDMALTNLLTNAAKYTKMTADITVTFTEEASDIIISVADKGIGIPPEDLDSIWLRFFTVDKAHSRKMGGTGLGLSIVKTIVDKHFGQVSVSSTVGKGTTFTLKLPKTRKRGRSWGPTA